MIAEGPFCCACLENNVIDGCLAIAVGSEQSLRRIEYFSFLPYYTNTIEF